MEVLIPDVARFGRASAVVSPSEIDKAYAAGLFDGEGNVTIAARAQVGARGLIYNMRVGASQNDPAPLFWLRDRWGGSVNPVKRKTVRHNTTHIWGCFSRKAEAFLRDVRPYLLVKSERADIALAFQNLVFIPGWSGHSDEYRSKLAQLKTQLNELNGHKRIAA